MYYFYTHTLNTDLSTTFTTVSGDQLGWFRNGYNRSITRRNQRFLWIFNLHHTMSYLTLVNFWFFIKFLIFLFFDDFTNIFMIFQYFYIFSKLSDRMYVCISCTCPYIYITDNLDKLWIINLNLGTFLYWYNNIIVSIDS